MEGKARRCLRSAAKVEEKNMIRMSPGLFTQSFPSWRRLTITPSAGLELQRDIDLSGRLAGVWRPGIAFGLDVGWLF